MVAPIEDGDMLLGILLGWGPTVAQERSLIETLARVAGMAWHSVEDRPEQALAPAAGVAMPPTQLAASIREIIAPGESAQPCSRWYVSVIALSGATRPCAASARRMASAIQTTSSPLRQPRA